VAQASDPSNEVWLVRLWRDHAYTLVSLLILLLFTALLYIFSTWPTLQLAHGAKLLAQSAKRVTAQHGNDEALERELLAQLGEIQYRDDLRAVAIHISIAFLVAFVIILTVEISSRARTQREINKYRDAVAHEVWSALLGQLVPTQIVGEIQGILKSNVVKENVRYTLTFMRHEGMPDDVIVLQRQVVYVLRNLTGRQISHPVVSIFESVMPDYECHDKGNVRFTIPRHIKLNVDKDEIKLSAEDGTLRRNARGQLRELRHIVTLGRDRDTAEVFLFSEEPVPISGQNHYVQTVPVTGLTVRYENKIDNLIEVTDVQLLHPNWESFAKGADGVSYSYAGGILPGQAFEIFWRFKGASARKPDQPVRRFEPGIRPLPR